MRQYKFVALTLALSSIFSLVPTFAETAAKLPSDKKIQAIEAKLDQQIPPSDEDFQTLGEIALAEPTNPKVHLVLGLCFEAKGLAKQAFEQYAEASKVSPNDPKPMVDLALARIRVGDVTNISGLIAEAGRKFPDDAEVLFLEGYDALTNKKWNVARQKLLKAYGMNPNIPYLKSCLAELSYNRANFQLAADLAHQELKTMPNDPRANMIMGLSLINRGIFSDSVPYLYKACAAMPNRSDLDDKASFFLSWDGRYGEALAPTLCCIAMTSGQYRNRDSLLKRLDDCLAHTTKEKALSTINEIATKFSPAKTNYAYFNTVGQALATRGWHPEARAAFQQAIDIEKMEGNQDGLPYFYLAREYESNVHDYPRAIELYRQAEQLALPSDISAAGYIERLEDRYALYDRDLAWRLKDMLSRGDR